MISNKFLFSLFFLCLISSSLQHKYWDYWTIQNNTITINSQESNLTDGQRDNYYYWVGLRNSFYFSEDSNQLEKVVKYFTPEEEDYYLKLFNFSVPGFICCAAVIVIFLVYLIKRFLLKGCRGPKIVVKSYHYTTYFFIGFGFISGIVFLSFTIYNCGQSNSHINRMLEKSVEQKEVLEEIEEITYKNIDEFKKNFSQFKNITSDLYGESLIKQNNKELGEKFQNFYDDLYGIQKHKFRFQVASLVLFIIISLVGIAGYWIRREYIPWVASMLLLLLAAPVSAMFGLETTYTFLSIDFCSSIGNSIISGIIPSENKGIGTYFSCPSKETMRTISTAIYQYIVDFDYLYGQIENIYDERKYFKVYFDLGTDKRNNTFFLDLAYRLRNANLSHYAEQEDIIYDKKVDEAYRDLIVKNLEAFPALNNLLAGLLSMTSCFTAKNTINYIEENYCYSNHAYMFRNCIFDILSALAFIITSVGLNKLIITMRSHFARALRGKKEFNNDIIDEDDE